MNNTSPETTVAHLGATVCKNEDYSSCYARCRPGIRSLDPLNHHEFDLVVKPRIPVLDTTNTMIMSLVFVFIQHTHFQCVNVMLIYIRFETKRDQYALCSSFTFQLTFLNRFYFH